MQVGANLDGLGALLSMPNMTGRPGYWTMEMNGGSSAPYLARTPCVPLFCALFNRGGSRGFFRLPGAGGDHFIVRWSLRPVIFGVDLKSEEVCEKLSRNVRWLSGLIASDSEICGRLAALILRLRPVGLRSGDCDSQIAAG